ncbi:isotrichodermin C-15 hydroxylase [Hypoxylon sp. NC1633]|nr:isotrichodermin C-15 hydroxylase [Hypoxylon sp. NC1633]
MVFNVFLHPLRKYPGDRWGVASRLPYLWAKFHGTATHRSKRLHDKYGDVVRIAPDTLSYSTSQAWSDIYGPKQSKMRGNIPKDPLFLTGTPESLVGADEENHRRIRRFAAPGFSERSVALQYDLLERYTALFISRLRDESTRHGEVDFVYWINALTTDIIGELAFGENFGGLESGEVHPWLRAIFKFMKLAFLAIELKRFPRWVGRLCRLIVTGTMKRPGKVRSFGNDAVQRRMALGTDRPDLLSSMIKQHEQGKVSEGEVREAAVTFIIAGSETTATLLSGCLYLLCQNPVIMQKITDIIRSDYTSAADLNFVKLQNHEYLNAVLNEALRLYPPAPDSLFRRTKEPAVVLGEVVPPDTCMTVNLWAANRSPRNFHRPEEFVPERWLKDPPPEFQNDDRAVAKPFSFGPRDCLGKNLAWAEMRHVLASILWHLDAELLPASRNWIDDSRLYFLWEKPELMMRFKQREWE